MSHIRRHWVKRRVLLFFVIKISNRLATGYECW